MNLLDYLGFCPDDDVFFRVPDRDGGRFELSDASPPDGWSRATDADWVNLMPPGPVPRQGWKVHVSATLDTCEQVLRACWDHCTGAGLGFKFLRSRELVFVRSSKYGDRTASGKFVTVYPPDEQALERVLTGLGARLDGLPGPTILSDLRWAGGPLYTRYGSFVADRVRTDTGEFVPAMLDPEGTLVPDERRPGFRIPAWVHPPEFLAPALRARAEGRLTGFPYRPERALHFSNGGGVYRAVTDDGAVVLLKEARPHAGLDGNGEDAVVRLERERWALERLAGLAEVPALLDMRRGHEHLFLVRELVDGVTLHERVAATNPVLRAGAGPRDFAGYTRWALGVVDALERGLAAMHARGVVWRDLHPGNVLVRPDDSLAFIDLEASRPTEDREAQALGAPGYVPPPHVRGADVDRYALAMTAVDLFVPLVTTTHWGPEVLEELLRLVERDFPVPPGYATRVRALQEPVEQEPVEQEPVGRGPVGPNGGGGPTAGIPTRPPVRTVPPDRWPPAVGGGGDGAAGWRAVARQLAGGVLANATPGREDRLYPGDPAALRVPGGGAGFLHGAAGVIWALRATGHEVPDEHVRWLRDAAGRVPPDACGLADGLAGVALGLHAAGADGPAHDVLRGAVLAGRDATGTGLADGLAGLGIALLAVAGDTEEATLVDAAAGLADRVADLVVAAPDPPWDRSRGPGLLGGPSGAALLHVRLYEATGLERELDRAERALRREIAGWGWDPALPMPRHLTGAMSLATGGGTALVLHALLRHRPAEDLRSARDGLRAACSVPFAADGGLLHGRAGLVAILAGTGGDARLIERHARDLRVHAVLLDGHPVATGRFGLRLSCDLGTGSAGLLLALAAVGDHVRLPFGLSAMGTRVSARTATSGAPR